MKKFATCIRLEDTATIMYSNVADSMIPIMIRLYFNILFWKIVIIYFKEISYSYTAHLTVWIVNHETICWGFGYELAQANICVPYTTDATI